MTCRLHDFFSLLAEVAGHHRWQITLHNFGGRVYRLIRTDQQHCPLCVVAQAHTGRPFSVMQHQEAARSIRLAPLDGEIIQRASDTIANWRPDVRRRLLSAVGLENDTGGSDE